MVGNGACGIAVLRVTNEQVLARPEEVVRRVRRLLSERLPGPLSRRVPSGEGRLTAVDATTG